MLFDQNIYGWGKMLNKESSQPATSKCLFEVSRRRIWREACLGEVAPFLDRLAQPH